MREMIDVLVSAKVNPEINEAHRIFDPSIAVRTNPRIHLGHESLRILRAELALCIEDVTFSVGYHDLYLQKAGIKISMEKKRVLRTSK